MTTEEVGVAVFGLYLFRSPNWLNIASICIVWMHSRTIELEAPTIKENSMNIGTLLLYIYVTLGRSIRTK
jgi:hypothetical protein